MAKSSSMQALLRHALLAGLGGGVAFTAMTADAQVQVEEIVVTARKQTESLQEVPITVTAFTSEMLTKSNAANLYDLNALAPGLNYSLGPARGGAGRLQMRGLTGGTSGGAKASVFLDGVYVSGDISDISFENLERVEVVPGPQSALYGRSTFAGAINYITRDPVADGYKAHVTTTIATLGDQEASIWAGGPLVGDKVLGAVNAYYQNFDGPDYWKALNGEQLGYTNSKAAGGKLIFLPSDEIRITARATYTRSRDGLGLATFQDPNTRNGTFVKPNGQIARYPVGQVPSVRGGAPDGLANAEFFTDPGRKNQNWRTSLQLDWDIAEHTFSALAAYNIERTTTQNDGDFTSFPSSRSYTSNRTRDKSIELRVTSGQEQRVRYTAGAYFLDLTNNGFGNGFSLTDFVCLTICTVNSPGVRSPVGARVNLSTFNTITNQSAFGGIYVDITDSITASFEGRYQSERIRSRTPTFQGDATFNAFLPRVNLQYKFSDDLQAYAVYSVGNNPGTFNTSPLIGTPGSNTTTADIPVKEEKLYNYEIGIKGTFLDGRATANLAAFILDWKNQQVPFTVQAANSTLFAIIQNRGASRVKGFSFESTWVPAEGWDLRGTVSYTKGKYLSFCSTNLAALLGVNLAPRNQFCVPVDGKTLDGVPDWTASLTAGYTAPLAGDWNWYARGDFSYLGSQWDAEFNFAYNEPGEVFGAHLGVDNGRLRVEVFCRNCTDEDAPYRIARTGDVRAGASNQVNQNIAQTPRRPRQVGIKAVFDM